MLANLGYNETSKREKLLMRQLRTQNHLDSVAHSQHAITVRSNQAAEESYGAQFWEAVILPLYFCLSAVPWFSYKICRFQITSWSV